MNLQAKFERWNALCDRISSLLIAVISFLRGLPLFVSARPKTPLRVLCIMAFDTLHRLRNAKRLPARKIKVLAALLDFGACANAAFDHKVYCRNEYCATLQLLEDAGIKPSVVEYLRRLRNLESRRPLPGGDHLQFQQVRLYREAVVRVSLEMVAATADSKQCFREGIRRTSCDADLDILFRIAMQCQIIDDVLDYAKDRAAELPGFLTATQPLPRALELTRLAVRAYADIRELPRTGDLFALRSALFLISSCTKLVVCLGRCWPRVHVGKQLAADVYEIESSLRMRRHFPFI